MPNETPLNLRVDEVLPQKRYIDFDPDRISGEIARDLCEPTERLYRRTPELKNDPFAAMRAVKLTDESEAKITDPVTGLLISAAKLQTARNELDLTPKQAGFFDGVMENIKGAAGWASGAAENIKDSIGRIKVSKKALIGAEAAIFALSSSGCTSVIIRPDSTPPPIESPVPSFVPSVDFIPPTNEATSEPTPVLTDWMTEDALKNTVIESGNINITLTDNTEISVPVDQIDERSTILWDKNVQLRDTTNNIIAIYDAEKGVWRAPISKEFSEQFPPVWSETTEGYADGLYIPITIGLTEGVVNNPTSPVKEVHMTKEGANAVASLFLHSCWARYRDLMGHPDVTYSEYIALVKEGKGNVDVLVTDENGTTKITASIDPRQGFSEVLTDKKDMPTTFNYYWGFLLESDEKGKYIVTTNMYLSLSENESIAQKKERGRDIVWFLQIIQTMAVPLMSVTNECMESSNVFLKCGNVAAPKDNGDWIGPLIKNYTEYYKGQSEPMVTFVR